MLHHRSSTQHSQFCRVGFVVNWCVPLLFFFLFIPVLLPASETGDIDVYVNSSVTDKVYSLSEIRSIFAMRKTVWPDGRKIKVFVLPDHSLFHRQFVKSRLNMFPHQFRRIWDRLIFSGVGQAPVEVESFEEMMKRLNNTPGGIGYLQVKPYNGKIRKLHYE